VYDSVGRTVGLTDASGVEPVYWQVEYDREDHITRLTQRNGSADADASVTELVYDAVGNLTRIVEPDGEVDDFVYDAEDSLVAMHSSSGYSAEFGYDAQRIRAARCSRSRTARSSGTQTALRSRTSRRADVKRATDVAPS